MKSKKKEKKESYNKDVDRSIKPTVTPKLCRCGNTEHQEGHCDGSHKQPTAKAIKMVKDSIPEDAEFVVTPTPRKMIIRKEVQADIDKVKKVKEMLASGHYNYNQIAGGLMIPLERVIQIHKDGKTNP